MWLSTEEREKLQKREEEMRNKKYESRITRTRKFDFAGREIIDEIEEFDHNLDAELRASAQAMIATVSNDANVCPSIEFDRPTVRHQIFSVRFLQLGNKIGSFFSVRGYEYFGFELGEIESC